MPDLRLGGSGILTRLRRTVPSEIARAFSKPTETEPLAAGKYETRIQSYFTVPGETKVLYTAANWIELLVTLETAGPVAIGTTEQIQPVLSGKGRLLAPGVEARFHLYRGDRLYIAADTINRISFIAHHVAWQQQILATVAAAVDASKGIASSIGSLFGDKAPGAEAADVLPSPNRKWLPRMRIR